jgi:hypothetical protein
MEDSTMSATVNGHAPRMTPQAVSIHDPIKTALEVLAEVISQGETLRIYVERAGLRATLDVQKIGEPTPKTPPATAAVEPAGALNPTEEKILDVLRNADSPLKGITIARRSNVAYNSHFRRKISSLKKKGILISEDCRYWLASRPLLEAQQ